MKYLRAEEHVGCPLGWKRQLRCEEAVAATAAAVTRWLLYRSSHQVASHAIYRLHVTITHHNMVWYLFSQFAADSGATSSAGKAAASPPSPAVSAPAPKRKPAAAAAKPGVSGGSAGGSQDPQQPKRRGRPPGSKSKPKAPAKTAVAAEDVLDDD